MPTLKHLLMTAATALTVLGSAARASATHDALAVAADMHRGVSILGYDPLWTDPAKARFKPRYYAMIRRAGFDYVRVVLQSFPHMDAKNQLDDRWLRTLDGVVRDATAAGLRVILDEHDFNLCSDDADACETKLQAFWRQVGTRYRTAPASVLFELLNEPHGALDGERWNGLLSRLLPLVRATNPDRTLIVGPTHWNSLSDLPQLRLPATDRNIIVTFHYYEPFRFTHQGAPWVPEFKDQHGNPFTPADEARIAADFARVADWGRANGRPVLLGEFGAYDRSGTPIEARARYAAVVRKTAEADAFPWCYWQFDSDFILYDVKTEQWQKPLLDALVGMP